MAARRPPEPRRRPLVAGNWKMNGTRAQAQHLAAIAIETAKEAPGVEVAVFPPFVWLEAVAELLRASQGPVALGGQSCHGDEKGAHTGAVSAAMLAEVGCTYVLAGHSEVRRECGADDARVRASAAAGLGAGLRVLLCVGEDGFERETGRAREVLVRQVDAVVAGLAGASDRLDVAYEPVWAIGTGRHAAPEQAAEAHGWVRDRLDAAGMERARILYGGSVTPANIDGFLAQPAVDGVLVGGQSLDGGAFASLVRAALARGTPPVSGRSRP
jgi:triosephosphate isomerase (TIM)